MRRERGRDHVTDLPRRIALTAHLDFDRRWIDACWLTGVVALAEAKRDLGINAAADVRTLTRGCVDGVGR